MEKTINAPNVQRLLHRHVENMSAKVMRLWQMKPLVFMRDNFDVTLDAWQQDAVDLYTHNQRLAMICSKGPGKTMLLAMFGWHFFLTNKLPKMAALSISSKNLKANLWAELALWGSRSDLVTKSATVKSERITLNGYEKMSFIDARSYEKEADESNQATALAGLHADNICFLIDEGGEIPDAVIITADAALSGGEDSEKKARLLVAANPTRPSGLIFRASKGISAQPWATLHVSGAPDDPKRAKRVSRDWALSLKAEYGEESTYYRVNVLGLYPLTSDTQLLTEQEIDDSINRTVTEDRLRPFRTVLGADIARGGADSTILAIRRGRKLLKIIPLSSSLDGTQVASQIIFHAKEFKVHKVIVDDTGGYGSSVIDCLKFQKNFMVEGMNYSRKARDERKYANIRSEAYIKMRDWVKSGGKLINDHRLKQDLMAPTISFHQGRFKLEDKESIKKRLSRSPDRADALCQTFLDDDHDLLDSYTERLGAIGGHTSHGEAPTYPNYTSH